jgi:hypothetical protein
MTKILDDSIPPFLLVLGKAKTPNVISEMAFLISIEEEYKNNAKIKTYKTTRKAKRRI